MTVAASLIGGFLRRANRRALRFDTSQPAMPQPRGGRRYLLYLHVPFCESLCPFCSFHRVQFTARRAHPYFAALEAEVSGYQALGFEFDEVYVGGGTPTVLPDQLAALLGGLRSRFPIRDISVETNPNHLRPAVIDALRAAGVTRLSVGVQSFDDRLLKSMGRFRSYGSGAEIADRLARVSGIFPTLNVDLMFNLPGQSAESFARDLAILREEIEVSQASFYPLMATSYTRERMRREMGIAARDREFEFYRMIGPGLGPAYQPDSAWCFSRGAGMVDEYVTTEDDYVGAGSGAFGFLHGRLTANTFSLREYQARIAAGDLGITRSRLLSRREQMRYHLLMRLFGLHLDKSVTRERFGQHAWVSLWPEVSMLKLIGAVTERHDQLHLTQRGRYYWVVMMREFFSGINRFRELMRERWRRDSRSDSAVSASFEGAIR